MDGDINRTIYNLGQKELVQELITNDSDKRMFKEMTIVNNTYDILGD